MADPTVIFTWGTVRHGHKNQNLKIFGSEIKPNCKKILTDNKCFYLNYPNQTKNQTIYPTYIS